MRNDSTGFFVGIDLGDIESEVAFLGRDSEKPEMGCVGNTISAMNEFFDRFDEPGKARVAVEAGTHSPWLSEVLRERGFEVLVGNAPKLRMIWGRLRWTGKRRSLGPSGNIIAGLAKTRSNACWLHFTHWNR
ncbi:MAG: hypothetical protein PVG49_20600 [Desulfobacteraceae bacterium]|jgi:hypothetical protein